MVRQWLVKLRKKNDRTQHSVALGMGFTDMRYMLIEHGQRQVDMNLSTVLKLADVFGISVEQVIKNEKSYVRSLKNAKAKQKAEAEV